MARMAHFTGLMLPAVDIQAGITTCGTMPPPIIDSGIMIAQAAPDAACSVLPSVATSIMKPQNASVAQSDARSSSGHEPGRTAKSATPIV